MKKVSLVALAVALTSSAAVMAADAPCPKAFQGFHLGGNIGYGIGKGKQKFYENNDADAESDFAINNDLGVSGIDGGIGTGYTHRFGNFALGLAFDANWASTSGKIKTYHEDDDNGPQYHTAKARLNNSLQLYGKAGYVICEKTMPFIALGWDNSSWKQNFNVNDGEDDGFSYSNSKRKRTNGFLWKAGVDFLATRHVVLGFEYTGTIAGRKSFNVTDENSGRSFKTSFKPQYNKFALTARVVY